MPKKTEPNKWRSAGRESLLEELALKLAEKNGKQQPTHIERERARELVLERAQYKILVVHSNTLESGFLLRELEQQNFSVAGVTSLHDTSDLIKEANLCIVEKPVNGELERLRQIRDSYEFEKLPIYVFSDLAKPDALQYVEWMPKPMYPELVRRVMHEWESWRGTSFIDALQNPTDALLNDMMLNCERLRETHDTGLEQLIVKQFKTLIEHAPKDTRRFGVALYFYRTKRASHVEFPGVEKNTSISTDSLFTLNKVSESSEPFCMKFFNDEQRAKVEIAALREQERREKEDQVLDFGFRAPINAPKLLYDAVLTDVGEERKDFYVVEEFIRGPMLYTLMPEVVQKAREGERFAKLFKNASAFVKNAQIARLQENDMLNLGFPTIDTDYAEKVKENLTENIRYFRMKSTDELTNCLDACITVLFDSLSFEHTQYFDYNDTNLMMRINGHRRSTLADVEQLFLSRFEKGTLQMYSYWDVREFTDKRLSKVDFNKVFRKTSVLEDLVHEFSYYDWSPEEQERLDIHFLLFKRAERLIKDRDKSGKQESLKELAALKDKIRRIEEDNMPSKELEETQRQLSDYSRFKKVKPYIQFYRNIRWLGHVLRRYIPEHRQIMNYAQEQMKKLCKDSYAALFENKRGFSLESELAKYLQRAPQRDRRHFMSAAVFESDGANEVLKNALGPRLEDFVSFANMYLGAHQDLLHDVSHLKYYLKRSYMLIEGIIHSINQPAEAKRPEVPLTSIDDIDGLKAYKEAVVQNHELAKKGASQMAASRYFAAKFIQYVIGKLSNANLDYEKLSRAGVKE